MPETLEFTSGEIATVAKELAAPSSAASPTAAEPQTPDNGTAAPKEQLGASEQKPIVATKDDRIPLVEHKGVVDGFHKRLDALQWATNYTPEQVRKALDTADRYEREQAERERAKSTPSVPQADLRTEDGTKMFSEEQNMAAIEYAVNKAVGALREELGSRLSPFETEHQERERINRDVSQIQEALTWKGFEQHMPVVTKAIAEANAKGQTLSVRDAYILHVVPLLADATDATIAKKKEEWLAELNATTTKTTNEVIPGRTPASSRKKDTEMSISELFADEQAKRKAS